MMLHAVISSIKHAGAGETNRRAGDTESIIIPGREGGEAEGYGSRERMREGRTVTGNQAEL